ncbi:MAG: hypothetical protein HC917_10590 [Richelia sp. SM2_1_7]|nr:hypothetical protein [Richelia sp. SM2_1_7]
MKTRIFYDVEATSVARDADPISIGLVAVTETPWMVDVNILANYGDTYEQQIKNYLEIHPTKKEIKTIYCEFTDFNEYKCDDWVKENVVSKLYLKDLDLSNNDSECQMISTTENISKALKQWLSQFEEIEFWADFDVIDKPMLIDLIADWNYTDVDKEKIGLPIHLPNIRYDQFFDLHTVFKIKGIDTDISREEFSGIIHKVILLPFSNYNQTHNALFDAYISWLCYNKLMSNE